jgi:hypothetical protein
MALPRVKTSPSGSEGLFVWAMQRRSDRRASLQQVAGAKGHRRIGHAGQDVLNTAHDKTSKE